MKSPLILVSLAAAVCLVRVPLAAQDAVPETWAARPVPGSPFTLELPTGGPVLYRGDDLVGHEAFQSWAEFEGASRHVDLTLDRWRDNRWMNMIRVEYVIRKHDDGDFNHEFDYYLTKRDHETDVPAVKKRRGHRAYEAILELPDSRGEPTVQITYRLQQGRTSYLEITLDCRKNQLSRYLPYYKRVRDSIAFE